MARYRNYSDEDKAVALAFYDACCNQRMTARECGMPLRTLQLWIDQREKQAPSAPDAILVAEKRASLADRLEELAHRAVTQANERIDEASAAASATVMGIAVDKMRLLREQPTSISQQQPASIEERDRRVVEIVERARLRMVSGGDAG